LKWVGQLFEALEFIHNKNIIHRDIKTKNIVLDGENNLILVDFGFVKEIDEKGTKSYLGTPNYLAPEIFKDGEAYNKPVDIWSAGIVVFQLIQSCNENCIPWVDLRSNPKEIDKHLNQDTILEKICRKCLIIQPSERCTAKDVVKWLEDFKKDSPSL
jgi:serine/threonine protein kinase